MQEFSASDVTWVPSPVKLPAEPPRAIDWVPPGDDDSAGDDDDSASDEESSEEPEGEKAAE